MTKKQKILKLLAEKTWHNNSTWFSKEDFERMRFDSSYEYGDKYNDIIYTKRVLQKEGYRTLVGLNLSIYRKDGNDT